MTDDTPHDESTGLLGADSEALIEDIRRSLILHAAAFQRILDNTKNPSLFLAEFLEEASNRYMDFSLRVTAAYRASSKIE